MHPLGASADVLARATATRDARPLGFPLMAAGALTGLVGIAAVVFSQSAGGMQRYAYREVAGAALSLALMLFLAGSATSLPLARGPRLAGSVGTVLCAAGVAVFVFVYPYLWNTSRDHSIIAVVLYAGGLSLLFAANAQGLVAAYVDAREKRLAMGRTEDVTDEEVVRDILDTTSRQRLTWGGVRSHERDIQLSPDWGTAKLVGGGFERLGLVSKVDEAGLAEDVGALLTFRGVNTEAEESYDDSDATALARLRAAKEEEARSTWWGRVRAWFARRK